MNFHGLLGFSPCQGFRARVGPCTLASLEAPLSLPSAFPLVMPVFLVHLSRRRAPRLSHRTSHPFDHSNLGRSPTIDPMSPALTCHAPPLTSTIRRIRPSRRGAPCTARSSQASSRRNPNEMRASSTESEPSPSSTYRHPTKKTAGNTNRNRMEEHGRAARRLLCNL